MTIRSLSLKIDVCTHDGMRDGVPRLLDLLAARELRASFFLSFGPDNAGKAIYNTLRPGFLRKMFRSNALSMYGLRTALSGTLLPSRPIASAFPELVTRIGVENHDVALHGWDHRRWQDHVDQFSPQEAADALLRAHDCCVAMLGRPPDGTGAPAWRVTPASLRAQDDLGLAFASDLRGGPPCRLRVEGEALTTPQFPTTGPCIEELLAGGITAEADLARELCRYLSEVEHAVLAVHAEVEGGRYGRVLERVLDTFDGLPVVPLSDLARRVGTAQLPLRDLTHVTIPGRSGPIASSVALPGEDG